MIFFAGIVKNPHKPAYIRFLFLCCPNPIVASADVEATMAESPWSHPAAWNSTCVERIDGIDAQLSGQSPLWLIP
jgi:hypothetical protein